MGKNKRPVCSNCGRPLTKDIIEGHSKCICETQKSNSNLKEFHG